MTVEAGANEAKRPLHRRAVGVVVWAPSPLMMLVLAIWWTWRWACIPAGQGDTGMAVIAGFVHDALVLYGVFGLLRHRWAQRPAAAFQGLTAGVTALLAVSALCRSLDALQVHLTGGRMTAELARVLLADPVGELWGLRGLVFAVIASALAANFALRRDRQLWLRLLQRGVRAGARQDIVSGASLLTGLMLAIGRGADPASGAPEFAVGRAFWQAIAG